MKRNILYSILILFLCFNETGSAFQRYNKVVKFDPYFSKYSKRFFGPFFDWKLFKAQAVAESRLKPSAKSHVGAAGIMQIMPATFKEIKYKLQIVKGSRLQPKWSIAAGIYYNKKLWDLWSSRRSFGDRVDFMLGSYNAGKGNILKAQKIAKKNGLPENKWKSIQDVLPKVTGKRSKETINYVKKINHIKGVLK